uniref:Large ribosomal subunit protein uL23c n=1 Tax=Haplomitrium blumei TaxID=258993 RepID=A0A4Y5P8N5_9MARC|nr:ribosomal protein L23 [Haplomitrium blumei]QCW59376.1 ribosomal protein L23 [Haplomitrium blumei]
MDPVKYPVLTGKTIRLLEKNQYSFDVDLGSDKTEVKTWIELFFGVKVIAINSHQLPRRSKRIGSIVGYIPRRKRMIATLGSGHSIPLFSSK